MTILGSILLGVAILPYIAVPILIWKTQRFTSQVFLRHIQETFLPKEVLAEFRKFSHPLIERDFEACFDGVITDEFLGLRFYHRVLLNRVQKTWAICTAICDEGGVLQRKYCELKTQYLDASYSTHNSDLIGAPINSSNRKSIALPAKTDSETLLKIHLLNLTKLKIEDSIATLEPESATETLKRFMAEENEEQMELGAIFYDEGERLFRPTWSGAILIGWYSMWPLTFFRRLYSNLRIRSLMKELAAANP